MNISKLILKLKFNIQYYIIYNNIKKQSSNIFSYPLLVWLTFEKDSIYKDFLKGNSIKIQAINKLEKSKKLFIRKISKINKKYSKEVLDRYYKYCEKQELISEVKSIFGENCFEKEYN